MSSLIDNCAICRNKLDEKCVECNVTDPSKPEDKKDVCTTMTSAVCGHTYHKKCIERWLERRNICPLCMKTWKSNIGLNLKQLIAAKYVEDEEKILELCNLNLDPQVYEMLDVGISTYRISKMRTDIQKLLARTFSKHLDVKEIEELLSAKKIGKI